MSTTTKAPNLGAGFSTAVQNHAGTGKQLQHGNASQLGRALAMGSYFLTGIMAVNISQVIGTPLYLINRDWYDAWIAFTKQSMGLLVTTMTQFWAPTTVVISGDKSMRGQLLQTVESNLYCDFPHRLVFIANHQIYTDWLYIWWLAYASGMHGRIYIVLKESLRRIPIIGWGMQFSKFIFLKRNWEQDKPNLAKHMQHLNKSSEPMWLTLFPEGTNLAPGTRRASAKWAEKQGLNDLRHVLLPRSTGLRFMLQELRQTCDWVYDCTIAYEGVPRGQFAQDIYTLRAMYPGGRGTKSVSMHFRRFNVATIPLDDPDVFERWLRARWTEKDNLIEFHLQNGYFPADNGAEQFPDGRIKRGAGHITTQIRANKWYEFLQTFAPLGLFAMILYTFYGALPKNFIKAFQRQAIQSKLDMIRAAGQQVISKMNQPAQLPGTHMITNHQLSVLKKAMMQKHITINDETIQKALDAGFFKTKNGLPANGTRQLAVTNKAAAQMQAIDGAAKKTGLTSAEKRARARKRQAAQAAQAAATSTAVAAKQTNGVPRPGNAMPSKQQIASKPMTAANQGGKKPAAAVSQVKANVAPPRQPAPIIKSNPPASNKVTQKPVARPALPTATNSTNTVQTLSTTATTTKTAPTAPTSISAASRLKPTSGSAPKAGAAKKQLPKLGPPSNADTRSWTTTSSNRTIPKLEMRSGPKPASKVINGPKPITKPVAKPPAGPTPAAKKPSAANVAAKKPAAASAPKNNVPAAPAKAAKPSAPAKLPAKPAVQPQKKVVAPATRAAPPKR